VKALRGRLPDLFLAAVVAGLDLWTKALIRQGIPLHQDRPVIDGLLSLRHGRNPGMAFGLLARAGLPRQEVWLSVVGIVALMAIAFFLVRVPDRARMSRVALALVLGGALGNLVERLWRGYVTDFVHVFHGSWQWHDFNLADAAISVGVVLLLLGALQRR
jgi:signal peptidase II